VAHLGVAPAEAFFIDDVEANVTGAIEAGLRAYRFTGNEALARELAYHRLL
jgi:FMN phosphatase YigB (HAD superfamily)